MYLFCMYETEMAPECQTPGCVFFCNCKMDLLMEEIDSAVCVVCVFIWERELKNNKQ